MGSLPKRDFAGRVAERTLAEFLDDRCPQLAASIAYHVLFALFPLAIVLAGIFGIVVRLTGVRLDVVDTIVRNVPLSPDGADRLRELLLGATGNLSALGLLGVLGLVWSATGMMAAIRVALNEAWDVDEVRPFLKGKLIDVALVFSVAALATVSLGLTVLIRFAGGDTKAGAGVHLGAGWSTWVLGALVPLGLGFSIALFLYVTIPAAEVGWRDAWPAALVAACGFVVAENLFAVYVGNFANYNAVYGSLGAVIASMFFVYLSSLIFLLGAELASEWPRVRGAFERGEVDADGPPLREQARDLLLGLWTRKRQAEAEADEQSRPVRSDHS